MHLLTSYRKLFLSRKILILTDVDVGIYKNIDRLCILRHLYFQSISSGNKTKLSSKLSSYRKLFLSCKI
jgi:hypothetical protein